MDQYSFTKEISVSVRLGKEKSTTVGDDVEKRVKEIAMGSNSYILIVDKSVIFENSITYSGGDRIYKTKHSLKEREQDLQASNKLVFTNQI